MITFGLGDALVGITDYCPTPEGNENTPVRLGGPKDTDIAALMALRPDLVIANQEENPRAIVEAIREGGIPLWLTFPKSVAQAVESLWDLLRIFRCEDQVVRLQTLEIALGWERAAGADRTPRRYFAPIWVDQTHDGQGCWMTFNDQTYAGDLLRLVGGENAFAHRQRLYPKEANFGGCPPEDPGDRDTRYPWVSGQDIREANPEVLIFPTEPYPFDVDAVDQFCQSFPDLPAVQANRVVLVDGKLITWHGIRLAQSLAELPTLFMQLD
jgi:ABC-type Fe3+-hydroxamate transport system substrate-binding protein